MSDRLMGKDVPIEQDKGAMPRWMVRREIACSIARRTSAPDRGLKRSAIASVGVRLREASSRGVDFQRTTVLGRLPPKSGSVRANLSSATQAPYRRALRSMFLSCSRLADSFSFHPSTSPCVSVPRTSRNPFSTPCSSLAPASPC